MTLLVEFIEARLAEDHAIASAAKVRANGNVMYLDGRDVPVGGAGGPGGGGGGTMWDYNRALREVAAKRELIIRNTPIDECRGHPGPWLPHGEYGPGFCREPEEASVYHVLAAIYSDHPDYDPAWSE